ncbi:hypothetical protein SDC9_156984 [bioreactor metagenome]|uniref:Uncharacterized protein n=1 Tax=bioreactor metagenome TaxID=1076179 RepID=A0A645F839_9ZZZZ
MLKRFAGIDIGVALRNRNEHLACGVEYHDRLAVFKRKLIYKRNKQRTRYIAFAVLHDKFTYSRSFGVHIAQLHLRKCLPAEYSVPHCGKHEREHNSKNREARDAPQKNLLHYFSTSNL